MATFAQVIIDRSADREFDYEIPAALLGRVQAGSRVRVPLRNRSLLGTVIAVSDTTAAKGVRPLESVVGHRPILTPALLKIGAWMADYYCCPVETAMRSVLPQVIRKAEIGFREQVFARLVREVPGEELAQIRKRAPRQAEAIEYLQSASQPVSAAELQKACGATTQALRSLEARGILTTLSDTVPRDPYSGEVFLPSKPHTLNPEQLSAMEKIEDAVAHPERHKPMLLFGVTGSGKTELYLQGIELALRLGKSAIVLVPEISLTPQTVERFKSRFSENQNRIAVLHSHLSEGERHDEWHKIHEGIARIVIGARSAIFAPLENLGLIVVDEEHENSYKQEESPRYQARDIAVLRARIEGCPVLLGSATPSLESHHNVLLGKYELLSLTTRVDDRKMPMVRIIDLRMQSKKNRENALISDPLRTAVEKRLERREQTIFFLNRRGFSTSLLCPACGHVCQCAHCSVSLTYHRAAARLVCHICGHIEQAPKKCPKCHDSSIRYAGAGTEKIEDIVARMFPKARVARMDADTMTKKNAYRETLGAFRTGKIDILVGTQMIAKGLHFPNVTLVGILNADLGLHMPDFRAGERTFQLLTQVAGRAGRGDVEGEVFVQTFTPASPAIQWARKQDFEEFARQEMEFREKWEYPPFSHMILLTIRSPHERRASFTAETLERRLRDGLPPDAVLATPAPAPLEKSKGFFRFHLMLRAPGVLKMSRHVRSVLAELTFPEDVLVSVDVDPYQLL